MPPQYQIDEPSAILSPALLFYPEAIRGNLERMLSIAGQPDRLRPHAKTHKTREILRMALEMGIRKHKVATLAEAEMAARVGVPDVFIAYPLVGPNCPRLAQLVRSYPQTQFRVLVDHEDGIAQLAQALSGGPAVEALLDIDIGQHRTGVLPGPEAVRLYEILARQEQLRPGGLQVYDGHHHQPDPNERKAAVQQVLGPVGELLDELTRRGLPAPRIVAGGTPTFMLWAQSGLPGLECSPGTCVLNDHGYSSNFPELGMGLGALMLTRLVSKPTPRRVTFDLGTKAVASDPPAGKRVRLLDLPDAQAVTHNEEHLVIETPRAGELRLGHVAYAVPTHICPTCALHREALVVRDGQVVDRWEILARDRLLQPIPA